MDPRVYCGPVEDFAAALHQALDFCAFTPRERRVVLKPNLVRAYRSGTGNITPVWMVEAVIDVLLERYILDRIIVAESSSITQDTAHAICSSGLSRLNGAHRGLVSVLDLKREPYVRINGGLSRPRLLEGATLINLPVLKGHPQVTLTCCLKNLKGLASDQDKKMLHFHGLNEGLGKLEQFTPELNIVDASVCRWGLGPKEVSRMGRILAGVDPVAVDGVAGSMVGLDIGAIPYLAPLAAQRQPAVTNEPIPVLASWQPFVDFVSFPEADIFLGDSCNHCIEAAIAAAGSPFKPGTRRAQLYTKGALLAKVLSQRFGFRKDASKAGKPVIVIGRLEPWVRLPAGHPIIFAGKCALDNPGKAKGELGGCPPSPEEIFSRVETAKGLRS